MFEHLKSELYMTASLYVVDILRRIFLVRFFITARESPTDSTLKYSASSGRDRRPKTRYFASTGALFLTGGGWCNFPVLRKSIS